MYRSVLLIVFLLYYILTRIYHKSFLSFAEPIAYVLIGFITLSFVGEMIERFLPSKTSSMGSQKQFKKNYVKADNEEQKPELQSWKGTILVFISWIILNGTLGTLFLLHIFDQGIMILIALAYSVCDMICILFFCPFQTWMMHNRCCSTCRIYNWDFAMMFTPLIFIIFTPPAEGVIITPFAVILVISSLILLIKWEITYKLHPERFSSHTNMSLRCENCKEKLCAHKKQLQKLLLKSHQYVKDLKKKIEISKK